MKDNNDKSNENSSEEIKDESLAHPSKGKSLIQLFESIRETNENPKLERLISDLIEYRNIQEKNNLFLKKKSNEILFKNLLYDSVEKNLVQIIHIIKKENMETKIEKLYNWYIDQLKKFEDLRYINSKSYYEKDEFPEEDYILQKYPINDDYIPPDQILKEQRKHRNNILISESELNSYQRINLYDKMAQRKLNDIKSNKKIKKKKESKIKN